MAWRLQRGCTRPINPWLRVTSKLHGQRSALVPWMLCWQLLVRSSRCGVCSATSASVHCS